MTGAVTSVQVGSSPRCKSCHAAIWFGLTAKGHRMPLDPQPVDDGRVIVDQDMRLLNKMAAGFVGDKPAPEGLPVRVLHKGEPIDPDVPRYTSHFATCPNADRHRKTRASAAPADRGLTPQPTSVGTGGAQGPSFGEVANGTGAPTTVPGRRG